MNIGDISVIISVLAGMVAIPFAASTVSVADDYKYGLAAVLNSTPEFAANASSSIPTLISKTVSDEGIKYVYRTPYGEYSIFISPDRFEEALLKVGKKVSFLQSSSEQVWELSAPSESLAISHAEQKIVETYRNLNGYLKILTENGWVSRNKSGTASEEELQSGMLRLESEMNETISLMKEMSEKILDAKSETQTNQTVQEGNITINEFLPAPDTTIGESEWIELYNSGDTNISLANWLLISTSSTSTYTLVIGNVIIPPNGFVYFVAGNRSTTTNGSSEWTGKWALLSNGAGSVTLEDNNGDMVDSYSYTKTYKSMSIGRRPDGGDWMPSLPPTPGATNT